MNIAFFITNHGFGHLMRNMPVIIEILGSGHDHLVVVAANPHISLAKEYFRYEKIDDSKIEYVPFDTDMGWILESGSLKVDVPELEKAVREYTTEWPERVEWAKKLFTEKDIDRVVVDIVPWALTAAKEAGIKSFLMASFTWLEQYQPYLSEDILAKYRKAYKDADKVLMYKLHDEMIPELYAERIDVGICARTMHPEQVEEIKRKAGMPIIFMSIGGSNDGIEGEIEVGNLPYIFITTPGLKLVGKNVWNLPKEINNTQDFIGAADYCISKAGWTTVAEMLATGKPMALLKRPDVIEDTQYIKRLEDSGNAIGIYTSELSHIESVIEKLKKVKSTKNIYKNDYKAIAEIISRKL